MSEQQKRPMPMSEVAESLRRKHRLLPALQQIIAQNRRCYEREREAVRAITHDFIERMQTHVATSLKLDPGVVCQMPDEVIDGLLSSLATLKALEDIPGTKINIDFTSTVTVNGVPLPDEE